MTSVVNSIERLIEYMDTSSEAESKQNGNSNDNTNSNTNQNRKPILLLFDVDGTLTKSRLQVQPFMVNLLKKAKQKVFVGIVGGSDYVKQQEQLDSLGNIRDYFDYVFSENGLVAYHNGQSINDHSLQKEIGDEDLNTFINWCLGYLSKLELPIKRGTFLEFRTGMINVSPIGRNCSQRERIAFYEMDQETHVRQTMIDAFTQELPALAAKLKCSIGGQISFDVFPHGWDKTYCLKFLYDDEHATKARDFEAIHFFGDKTYAGGNDHELFEDKRTIGHTVTNPRDTEKLVEQILEQL